MSKKNVNVEDVVTEGVKAAEDQTTVEAVEVVSEEKKLFGKIPMKTAKKVAIVVGVTGNGKLESYTPTDFIRDWYGRK